MPERAAILPGLPAGAGVAVIRLRSLGDAVLMTPALAALQRWRPDLRLAVLLEPRFAGVLAGNPDVATLIEVPSGPAARARALRRVRRFRPALAVGLHGGTTAAWFARLSGARWRATFQGLRHTWAYNLFTPPLPPPPGRAGLPTPVHVLSLFEALGLPPAPLGPARVCVAPGAAAAVRRGLAERGVSGTYAFLHLEAREPGMRWPLERFRALAAWLRATYGWAAVAATPGPAPSLEGITVFAGTSVAELVALENGAAMVLGNDGGPIHIAAALGKPIVAWYASTVLDIWAPWQARAEILQAHDLRELTLPAVQAAVRTLYDKSVQPAISPDRPI